MTKEKSVNQVLEDLKTQRATLDERIKWLEGIISGKSIGTSSISTEGTAERIQATIQPEAFVGLSTLDAIKAYLKLVGAPARSTVTIGEGLSGGGLPVVPSTLVSVLSRAARKKNGIKKTPLGWGLLAWYERNEKEILPKGKTGNEETK